MYRRARFLEDLLNYFKCLKRLKLVWEIYIFFKIINGICSTRVDS